MLLVHVVHCSPEIVGNADSICSLRAGISTGIIVGATSLCERAGVSTGIVDVSSIGQVSWWLPCWNYWAC